MPLKQQKIAAFPDGYTIAELNSGSDKLLVGNSVGILKIFETKNPDLEPRSIDIVDKLTSISIHENRALITNTMGLVELVGLEAHEASFGVLYRTELPLRHGTFINEGKRVVCGGDEGKLIVINIEDREDSNEDQPPESIDIINLPDSLVGLTYDATSEMLAVSVSNGDVQLYSAINEKLNLINTLKSAVPTKVFTSMQELDFAGESAGDLVATSCQWTKNSEMLVPAATNAIKKYDRSGELIGELSIDNTIVDFKSNKHMLAVLTKDKLVVADFNSMESIKHFDLSAEELLINLTWSNDHLYLGTNNGVVVFLPELADQLPKVSPAADNTPEVDANSNTEALFSDNGARGIDDSIIDASDEDDEDGDEEGGQDSRFPYYNKDVGHILNQRKRQKANNGRSVSPAVASSAYFVDEEDIVPYSPGSTPFSSSSQVERRYITMNSVGYVWAVKTEEQTQSITVSFFDRSINKDYHFNDFNKFDLCGINEHGIVLGSSNYKQGKKFGTIYYRNHDSDSNSWDKKVPLSKDEFISSVSITNNQESTIIVGTNFGYLRYYNNHGLCLDILKVSPIVSIICNDKVVFVVSKLSASLYSYSMILEEDSRFLQQDCILPLRKPKSKTVPLIKGIFFNEYNDPCLVSGNDDTLIVLSNWREPKNSKWVPILNCTKAIMDGNDMKKTWKVWPLGLFNDKLNCLLIKNNDNYPGFPLPMPIELSIKLPINMGGDEEQPESEEKQEDTDDVLEENFIKSITMGKLINDSLVDEGLQEFNDEMVEKLNYYTSLFDKSLLKLFANSCKTGDISRSYSIARMMKNDKALIAASKICQRFEFNNLASKIGKLRDNLMQLEEN